MAPLPTPHRRRTLVWLRVLAVVGVGAALEPEAAAYDFEVSSRTEAYAYQVRRLDRAGLTLLNRRRFTQYLGVRLFNLLDSGEDAYSPTRRDRPPALLWVHGSMRFFTDFGDFVDPIESIDELEDDQFELLLGSVEARNLWGYVDFSLGRQYDAELMDFFAYDGLRVRVNSPWHLFVETSVGIQVNRTNPFAASVFETDGTSGFSPADEAISPAFGVAVGIDDPDLVEMRLAYRGVTSRAEVAGLAGPAGEPRWGTDQELVFAHVALPLPLLGQRLSAGARFNLLTSGFDEVQLSSIQRLGERQQIELAWQRSRPHFDGDSIFNIFAVEPYHELSASYLLRLLASLRLEGRGGYRWFFGAEGDEVGEHTAWSLAAIVSWQRARFGASAELFYLDGYGGLRVGGDVGGRWLSPRFIFGRRLGVEGRMSVIYVDDDLGIADPLTTFALQMGAHIEILRDVALGVSLENNISQLYASALRVLAVLDMRFAP